ncbi:MAG: hypothetical protein J7L35_10880 [Anaerolineales bacterium]|nr:hypothetical protein [Anaerolineales bacterium]
MESLFSRTRRNHGLEHATLNLLAKTHPGQPFAGHSDGGGFWILGDIPTEILSSTVSEALSKLNAGQSELAIHNNCGTNLLVSGFAAGLAGAAGLIGVGKQARDKFERIPVITFFGVLALIAARPLGPLLQKKVTTSGNPGNLMISTISKHTMNGTSAHRIKTLD